MPGTTADVKAQDLVVTVCGGGNAAHVAAGMFSKNGAKVNMYLPLDKELQAWQSSADKNGITVHVTQAGTHYTGRLNKISGKPEDVIPGSQLVIMTVPAFAHKPILSAISAHLSPNTVVLAMPAPGAFDLLARHLLGDKANDVVIAGTVCLPWACRIKEYGKSVDLLGCKSPVSVVCRPAKPAVPVTQMLNAIFDDSTFKLGTLFLEATLFPTNPILHPGVMYSKWHDWDGMALESKPLFYEGVDEFAAGIIEGEDQDIQATRRAIEKELGISLHIPTMVEQMVEGYGDQISDPTTYQSMLQTNKALQGLFHPMKATQDGKWEPDFSYRYLWEDIPHGLITMKGIAQLMGVETPHFDRVLSWAQSRMGKEYLVDGKLSGEHVPEAAAPQSFGITSKELLVEELKHQMKEQ